MKITNEIIEKFNLAIQKKFSEPINTNFGGKA
jgi:hypothetical protein